MAPDHICPVESFADDSNADAYNQAWVCGWDDYYKDINKVKAEANNGIWFTPVNSPANVQVAHNQEIIDSGYEYASNSLVAYTIG